MIIRKPTSSDKQGIIELSKLFFDERLKDFGLVFSQTNAEKHFYLLLNNSLSLCAEEDGNIIGLIAGVIGPKLFCEGLTCQEVIWFVDPKRRKCGVKLLSAFERMVAESGCDDITMIGLEGDKSNQFYIRKGYKLTQNFYVKEL